jgi:hypothetical protein
MDGIVDVSGRQMKPIVKLLIVIPIANLAANLFYVQVFMVDSIFLDIYLIFLDCL